MLAHESLEKHFLEWVKKEASAEEDAAKTIGAPIAVLALNGALFGFMLGLVGEAPRDFSIIVLLVPDVSCRQGTRCSSVWREMSR